MRRVWFVLAMLSVAPLAFSRGRAEHGSAAPAMFIVKDSAGQTMKQFNAWITFSSGETRVRLTWKDDGSSTYGLLRVGDEYRDLRLGMGIPGASYYFERATVAITRPLEGTYDVNATDKRLMILDSTCSRGTGPALTLIQKALLFLLSPNEVTITWAGGEEKEYELLLMKGNGDFEDLKFSLAPQFFAGEHDLFAQVESGSYSYQQQALAFLGSIFPGDDFKVKVSPIFGYTVQDDFWDMFDTSTDAYKQARLSFAKAFMSHFSATVCEQSLEGQTLSLPCLDLPKTTFEDIYGKDRNVYVSAYLYYLYKISKPVLSHPIQEKMRASGLPYPYDYTDFTQISVDEGKLLAEKATYYLTWGLEYTLANKLNALSYSATGRPIYGRFRDAILDPWMANPSDDAATNYLPVGASPKSLGVEEELGAQAPILKVHVLEDDYFSKDLWLYGPPSQSLNISRIDLFTSENIAWKEGRIKSPVVSAGGSGSILNGALLNDRKMYLNHETGSSVHIKRLNEGSPMYVGYEFNQPERIGGMVLVNGKWAGNYTVKSGEHPISFEIKTSPDGQWVAVDLEAAQFKEYAFDYKSGSPMYTNRSDLPGYHLTSGNYYTNGGTMLSYVYFVFSAGITDCYGIRFVDQTTNPYLNVTELMVFPDDPIQYVSSLPGDPLISSIFAQRSFVTIAKSEWAEGPQRGASFLPFNGNMSNYYIVPAGDGRSEIGFLLGKQSVGIRSVVVWENGHEAGDSSMTDEFVVFTKRMDIMNSQYFQAQKDISKSIKGVLKTPYSEVGGDTARQGNPLPYASKGIDGPRTFNYKLMEQDAARRWYAEKVTTAAGRFPASQNTTTRGVDETGRENYSESYVNEMEVIKALRPDAALSVGGNYLYRPGSTPTDLPLTDADVQLKPFLPGKYINTARGYVVTNSPFTVDRIAGVDSLGFLTGSIAMSGVGTNGIADKVLDISNIPPATVLNAYYKMSSASVEISGKSVPVKGLDASGKPAFSVLDEDESILSGRYRFSRADIERNTVLVPDLREIREGDLIVRYPVDGEPHIGIVVGFLPGERPAYGQDGSSFMEKVLVVSVRRGFQTVTSGVWGNPTGLFGGFTDKPTEYQVRRLLKRTGTVDTMRAKDADSWELVKDAPFKYYTDYPEPKRYPFNWATVDSFYRIEGWDGDTTPVPAVETLVQRIITGAFPFRAGAAEYSGLKYVEHLPPTSFRNWPAAPVVEWSPGMEFSSITGWRKRNDGVLDYHTGIDITGVMGAQISAPEDGIFYIFSSELPAPIQLPITIRAKIDISITTITHGNWGDTSNGIVSVFISNPADPENCRIYLFTHIGPPSDISSFEEAEADLTSRYQDAYGLGRVLPRAAMPQKVEKGDWIGALGERGKAGAPHTHLEVFEFFPDDPAFNSGDDNYYKVAGLQRIDPKSLFDPADYTAIDRVPTTKALFPLDQRTLQDCFRRWRYVE